MKFRTQVSSHAKFWWVGNLVQDPSNKNLVNNAIFWRFLARVSDDSTRAITAGLEIIIVVYSRSLGGLLAYIMLSVWYFSSGLSIFQTCDDASGQTG